MSEKATKKRASLFELDGVPSFGQAFPLSLQHVVAMIVGCVTPAIIIAGVSGLSDSDSVILIQSALVVAGLSTVSHWEKGRISFRLRTSCDYGCQLCLSSQYAGDSR